MSHFTHGPAELRIGLLEQHGWRMTQAAATLVGVEIELLDDRFQLSQRPLLCDKARYHIEKENGVFLKLQSDLQHLVSVGQV